GAFSYKRIRAMLPSNKPSRSGLSGSSQGSLRSGGYAALQLKANHLHPHARVAHCWKASPADSYLEERPPI
ncbi:hypothetical protein, partial [Paraglaciecola sp.]|uniref:hypothetical protein n=1 Tax=Paraglaciecola sp. TaxID=1920173 RepID=UPI003297DF56